MAMAQIATSVSVISSGLKGYQAVSLTNFATSAQSVIASGSALEIANAFFLASSDTTPQASTWTAISTAATAYIKCLPSGTAGSQVITAQYSSTAPTWSDSKQGWYASAASVTRYIGGVTKTSATQYNAAFILESDIQRNAPANTKRIVDEFIFDDGNEPDYSGSITDAMAAATVTFSELPKNTREILVRLELADTGTVPTFSWKRTSGGSTTYICRSEFADGGTNQYYGTFWMPTGGNSIYVTEVKADVVSSFEIIAYKVAV